MKINTLNCIIAIFLGGVVASMIPERYVSKISITEIVISLIFGIVVLSILLVKYSELINKINSEVR